MVSSGANQCSGAVEGIVDEAVLRRIWTEVGIEAAVVYVASGKHRLVQRLPGFNQAAKWSRWSVLIDLDHDAPCAVAFCRRLLADPAPQFCLCVVVREVESWLLADRAGMARFLGVAITQLPTEPETLDQPKQLIVNLARRSRRRDIRAGMVPRAGSGRDVGPAYAALMIEFATAEWLPARAAQHATSLRRCLDRLRALTRQE